MNWPTFLLDLLYPKKCVGCGKRGRYVCERCEVGLWEEEQICPICCRLSRYGSRHKYCRQPYSLDGLTCLWAYEGIAKKIIKKAKYKFFYDLLHELVVSDLGSRIELADFVRFVDSGPVVVPAPLHPRRERERGFNQARVIVDLVARFWGLDSRDFLVRTRDTGHQTGRNKQERLEAVQGAFSLAPKTFNLKPKVLLVDDVWTTGATMSECCRVLKRAGVKTVWGLVLAR